MKKLTSFLLTLLLFSALLSPLSFAEGTYVFDSAGILSSSELQQLNQRAQKVSESTGTDVIIWFCESFEGLDPGEYCDRVWQNNGFSEDCCMFAIAFSERAYYYYACGEGSVITTDYGSQYIDEQILPSLQNGNYEKAASLFITYTAEFITHYNQTGSAYDVNDKPNTLKMLLLRIFGTTGIGLLLAGIPLRAQKKKLKTVNAQASANNYERSPLRLTSQRDMLINSHVTKIPIPRQSPSSGRGGFSGGGTTMHHSSSGHSYSGHGGHF